MSLRRSAKGKAGCANRSVSAREHDGEILFFHKVGEGAASRSYGVACARLAGLPEVVLQRARAILDGLEARGEAPRVGAGEPSSVARRTEPQEERVSAEAQTHGEARIEQLGLFALREAPAAAMGVNEPRERGAVALAARLREVDPDALTPLQALLLVVELKRSLEASEREQRADHTKSRARRP